jgi:hypothetical protein
MELVTTILLKLYLKEVVSLGPGPRRHGAAPTRHGHHTEEVGTRTGVIQVKAKPNSFEQTDSKSYSIF